MTPDPLAALLRDAMHLRAGTGHNTYEAVAARLRDAGVRLGPLDDLSVERLARQHFEARRHFFEDTTASGVCAECGEDSEQDFVRVTMHFTDGDG